MDVYQRLGFNRPPFDPVPDPEVFHAAPTHAEALAMLDFAVHAGRGCCAVIAESGLGKTLLARKVARAAPAGMPVFWISGCTQPDNQTEVCLLRTGLGRGGVEIAERITVSGAAWRASRWSSAGMLLIVDDADELPPRGWKDVTGWLADDAWRRQPSTLLLFGQPGMLETLNSPAGDRIRSRLFRVCRLEPFSRGQTAGYVRSRLSVAGNGAAARFETEALSAVHELSGGNPALINQLCENALLEACAEQRDQVTAADVRNAWRSLARAQLEEERQRTELAMAAERSRAESKSAAGGVANASGTAAVDKSATAEQRVRVPDVRLRDIEQRLCQALLKVRRAREAVRRRLERRAVNAATKPAPGSAPEAPATSRAAPEPVSA